MTTTSTPNSAVETQTVEVPSTIIIKLRNFQSLAALKGLITNRDQYEMKGNGGVNPSFKGSATTVGGREVSVSVTGDHRFDGTITIIYPGPRQGYGLLETIVAELLQEETRSSLSEIPPTPPSWAAVERVWVADPLHPEHRFSPYFGETIKWGWVRPYPEHGWFWKPTGE